MYNNPNKTASANSKGIVISFRDSEKHKFFPYESSYVKSIQTEGHTRYQKVEVEKPVFSAQQQKMYAEVVYGLGYFPPEVAKTMNEHTKSRLLTRFNKAQRILNRWKQEITNQKVDSFLLAMFPDSPVTKVFVETKGHHRDLKATQSFKELGLTQEKIAEKLIEVRLLPSNFFELQ